MRLNAIMFTFFICKLSELYWFVLRFSIMGCSYVNLLQRLQIREIIREATGTPCIMVHFMLPPPCFILDEAHLSLEHYKIWKLHEEGANTYAEHCKMICLLLGIKKTSKKKKKNTQKNLIQTSTFQPNPSRSYRPQAPRVRRRTCRWPAGSSCCILGRVP